MTDIKLGFVDYTALVYIPDPASTDGSGKTGLVAANLTVSYTRVETDNDVVVTDVTSSLSNLAALTTAHTDWGLLEVSSTLAPGLYRLDIADAVFASGAWSAVVYVMVTTSAAAASPMKFDLVAFDRLDAAGLGLSRIDAAVTTRSSQTSLDTVDDLLDTELPALTTAVADLPTNAELATALGTADDATLAAIVTLQADTDNIQTRLPAALVGGRMDVSVGAMAANVMTAAAAAADLTTELQTGLATSAALTTVEGKIDIVDTVADAILIDTTEIGAAGAGLSAIPWNASWDAEVQSEATDALNAYDPPTRAEATTDVNSVLTAVDALPTNAELATALAAADDAVLAAIAALNNLSSAQINAEVVDALNVDTYAEPGQVAAPATASLVAKLGFLYKAWRNNHTQTATEYNLLNDDAVTVGQKATTADDGTTFSRTEIVSGP